MNISRHRTLQISEITQFTFKEEAAAIELLSSVSALEASISHHAQLTNQSLPMDRMFEQPSNRRQSINFHSQFIY